ncbi:MAG TPA: DUF6508 domain-containing protein [Candidatus Cloacimonadota bacterium]|nr:DUF6508 domain-containing protein [Candidatus Cloacimonadota bacterium]
MAQYDKLLAYISYFEEGLNENGNWFHPEHDLPYIEYEDKMRSFIRDVSESGVMKQDYLSYFDYPIPQETVDGIEAADIDLLKAIFTFINRQERFQEGL